MKKTISFLLTLCMIVGLMPAAMAAKKATFKDVPENMWCFKYVEYVAEEGYFKGTTETTFEPNAPMTRQQFVVVLSRMVNAKVNNNQSPFSDVPAGSYSAGAIAWAARHNIVQGYEDGTFHPTEPITRQQMAALMNRFMTYYANNYGARYISKNAKINFKDADSIGAYAKSAVDYCVKYGLILGYEDGTFRPNATATRAHVAAIIERLDQVTRKGGGGGGGVVITPTTTTYTVTYQNADGSTIGDVETYDEDSVVTVRAALAEDDERIYTGWVVESGANEGETYVGGETFTITANTVLKATCIEKNDLLLNAFNTTVDYVNEVLFGEDGYYTKLQAAVGNIESVVVNEVELDTENDARDINVTASATLENGTIESLVKTAVNTAINMVKPGTYGDDETYDLEEIETIVKDVVDALGLEWDGEVSKAVAKDIYDQAKEIAKAEAKAADEVIRPAFKDEDKYFFDTVEVKVGDDVVCTLDTSENLTKDAAVDYAVALAKAAAKDLYKSLKNHGEPTKEIVLETSVVMTFEGLDTKAASYPNVYTVNVALTFTNDLVSYWYKNDAHNLQVNVTKDMQSAYDAALSAAAQKVVDVAMGDVYDDLDAAIADYVDTIKEDGTVKAALDMLKMFDIEADLDQAVADAVEAWKTANLSDSVAETEEAYGLYNFLWNLDGEIRLEDDTYALYRNGVKVTDKALLNNQCILDSITVWANNLMAEIQAVGSVKLLETAVETLISDAKAAEYQEKILGEFQNVLNNNEYTDLMESLGSFEAMFGYADRAEMFAASAADQIAAIDRALTSDFTSGGNRDTLAAAVQMLMIGKISGNDDPDDVVPDGAGVINEYYNDMVSGLNTGSAVEQKVYKLITDCSAACEIDDYLKKLAMERMGLEAYAASQYPDLNVEVEDGDDTNDAASVEAVVNAWIENNFDVAEMVGERITLAEINAKTDPKIVAMVTSAGEYLDALYLMQDVNTFGELAEKDAAALAEILGDKLPGVIAKAGISSDKMNKAMDAMAKAIEMLPASASVTINGVEFCEDELAAVKAAAQSHDIADVCDELANLVARLGGLSLKTCQSVPVEVAYGARSETCILHIVVA